MKRKITLLIVAILLVWGYIYFIEPLTNNSDTLVTNSPSPAPTPTAEPTPTPDPNLPTDLGPILDTSVGVPIDTIPNSYTVFVNRYYLLPSSYYPEDLIEPKIRFSFSEISDKRKLRKVAAHALEKMFRAAEKKNVILYGVSGYRSYKRQQDIYNRNIANRGQKATDAVSAMPGSSEHQTGLSIDISSRSVGCLLDPRLGDTKEGKWIAKNAHKFGFIVRFPYGKSKITGYSYEPWHIRYVGTDLAAYLYKNKLTLDEYYGFNSNKREEDTGVDVENPDEVSYATPKPEN